MTVAVNDHQLVVRIPAAVADQLDHIALKRKVTRSVVVRWAVDEYIEHFFSPTGSLKETKSPRVDNASTDTPGK